MIARPVVDDNHHSEFDAASAVGLGTTFTIALSTNGVHDASIQSTALRVAPG